MKIVLGLIACIFLFELIRDAGHPGDFIGYVNAGNAVLAGKNIYADHLNTWPPFFSVCSVPLALADNLSSYFIRFIWLSGMLAALFFSIKITVRLVFKKALVFKNSGAETNICWQDARIVVPLLLLLRFILDNLTSVQINIYLLWAALGSLLLIERKSYIWAALLLGFIVSIKVYPIFIVFYFLYKRAYKPVLWTLFFILICNSFSFLIFGNEQALAYYKYWIQEVVPYTHFQDHKNQSVFGVFLRFFTAEDPGNNMYVNVMSLAPETVRRYTYLVIAFFALFPAFLFRKKLSMLTETVLMLEYAVLFTVIPLITPVAWKMNFVFLWLPCFVLYHLLFCSDLSLSKIQLKLARIVFAIAMILNIFTSELFIGHYWSDLTEAYGFICFSSVLLILLQLGLYTKIKK